MLRNIRSVQQWYLYRGFKSQQNVLKISADSLPFTIGSLTDPFLFTAAVCSCSFCGAMIWQHESMRKMYQGQDYFNKSQLKQLKFTLPQKFYLWRKSYQEKKVIKGIIACNLGIVLLWQVPLLTSVMNNYFLISPLSSAPCWSLLLSVFSHENFLHFAINMLVLWTFTQEILKLYGREEFLAFYLSSGVLASFVSLTSKVVYYNTIKGSLGASGAIMAIIGSIGILHPDKQVSVAFIGPLSANMVMKGLIAIDVLGLLMGPGLFDHAAHLGGMLFGIWYAKYGRNVIWGNREYITKKWQRIRGPP